jgi:hypothetical protein
LWFWEESCDVCGSHSPDDDGHATADDARGSVAPPLLVDRNWDTLLDRVVILFLSLYIYIILQHCGLVSQALFFFSTHWMIDWHSRMSSCWCHNTAQSYYTSDDLHHRCLSRLKNFGRWSRRGDGRHNDYLNIHLWIQHYMWVLARTASQHTTHRHHHLLHSKYCNTRPVEQYGVVQTHNGGPTTATTTSHCGSSITRQGSYKRYSGVCI